jgi:NAD(P)H-quinone oxidoreductase subunit 5
MPLLGASTLFAPGFFLLAAVVAHIPGGNVPVKVAWAARLAVASLVLTAVLSFVNAVRAPEASGVLATVVLADGLSLLMLTLVAALGASVVQFARNYLQGEPRQALFVGDLALTVATVMLLVLSRNLVLLVLMWSASSWALHRLLVFYPERRGAVVAARKKFVVARAGDACLVAAALMLVHACGTSDILRIVARAKELSESTVWSPELGLADTLIVLTAAFKSAQFPLHGWLVEMQETPTPVSALLHAGILNGGTFLVVRFAGVVQASSAACLALVLIGGTTSVVASLMMIAEPRAKTSRTQVQPIWASCCSCAG